MDSFFVVVVLHNVVAETRGPAPRGNELHFCGGIRIPVIIETFEGVAAG
jgi:hypothetical protein